MYESYFELQQAPFSLTPNTHFFMSSPSHAQALEMLMVGLSNGEGFLKVTGEVGTGKSLICRMLLNSLEDDFVTAYVPNPNCSPETLYCLIAEELSEYEETGLQAHLSRHVDAYFNDSLTSEKQMLALQQIQKKLLILAEQDRKVVLIIDEAQSMRHETIEALRLISNLETESRKLLQIVLFAQPELDERLANPELRQLAQRISFHHRLSPLSDSATAEYVAFRLSQAGHEGSSIFTDRALRLVAKGSGGVPRLVNILCHKALIAAYGKGLKQVDADQVRDAIIDTPSAVQGFQISLKKPVSPRWAFVMLAFPIVGIWIAQTVSSLP